MIHIPVFRKPLMVLLVFGMVSGCIYRPGVCAVGGPRSVDKEPTSATVSLTWPLQHPAAVREKATKSGYDLQKLDQTILEEKDLKETARAYLTLTGIYHVARCQRERKFLIGKYLEFLDRMAVKAPGDGQWNSDLKVFRALAYEKNNQMAKAIALFDEVGIWEYDIYLRHFGEGDEQAEYGGYLLTLNYWAVRCEGQGITKKALVIHQKILDECANYKNKYKWFDALPEKNKQGLEYELKRSIYDSNYHMGDIEDKAGNKAEALQHYSTAKSIAETMNPKHVSFSLPKLSARIKEMESAVSQEKGIENFIPENN